MTSAKVETTLNMTGADYVGDGTIKQGLLNCRA